MNKSLPVNIIFNNIRNENKCNSVKSFEWWNYAGGKMTVLSMGVSAQSHFLGTNTALTWPPGNYSCASGSIVDSRNTLPWLLMSSWEIIRPWRVKAKFMVWRDNIEYWRPISNTNKKFRIDCYNNKKFKLHCVYFTDILNKYNTNGDLILRNVYCNS